MSSFKLKLIDLLERIDLKSFKKVQSYVHKILLCLSSAVYEFASLNLLTP